MNKDLTAKSIKLNDLSDYKKDSIVSQTILNKKAGTITFFAFDKGQFLSEHTAPFDALVYIIDGEAQITIAGKQNKVKEGEIMIMPADKPHSLKAINKFKMLLIMIKSN